MSYYGYPPYVPVAQRRANARREMNKLRKQGETIHPVDPFKGRKIARTFWGEGWCSHLEAFSDYENRLPRGRTYVRNGSVCHLGIEKGVVNAIVSGSELYEVSVTIKTMPQGKWGYIRKSCTGRIGSLLELLQGKFSDEVMCVVTDRDDGLFPLPGEMTFDCSCPDWAVMCKHVAAVLYGVGVRLDDSPELLFRLRGVDHEELIGGEAIAAASAAGRSGARRRRLKGDVASVFGVEVEETGKTSNAEAVHAPAQRSKGSPKRAKRSAVACKHSTGSDAGSLLNTPENRVAVAWLLDNLTGERVAHLVTASGLSRTSFAHRVNLSESAVSNWIKKRDGRIRMHSKSREALASCLDAAGAPATARISFRADKMRIAETLCQLASNLYPESVHARPAVVASKKKRGGKRPASRTKKQSTSAQTSIRRKANAPRPPTGKRVAALRKRMGLSAAAFGERIGVTAQTVYNWEKTRGRLRLRRQSRDALAALL